MCNCVQCMCNCVCVTVYVELCTWNCVCGTVYVELVNRFLLGTNCIWVFL